MFHSLAIVNIYGIKILAFSLKTLLKKYVLKYNSLL